MSSATQDVLSSEDVAEVLSGTFYANSYPAKRLTRSEPPERAAHYKVICISLYNQDLERLDEMVDVLKKRGFTKASRSALIRFALDNVDLEKVPKGL